MSTTHRTTLDKFSDALTQSEKRVVAVIVLLLAANILARIFFGGTALPTASFHRSLRDVERQELLPPATHSEVQPERGRKILPALASVDVNRASREELERLPSVGPAMAERIIAARAERAFTRRTDLRRVRGIGAKRLSQITPYLTLTK